LAGTAAKSCQPHDVTGRKPRRFRADDLGDGAAGHHAVGFHGRTISRAMHPRAVRRIERDVAHAHQRLTVLWRRDRALDHLEMLGSKLAARLLDQEDLAIDGRAHGVSSPHVLGDY
jgi:hypothetical protein